jgi:uroporphyrinogen-III synthase
VTKRDLTVALFRAREEAERSAAGLAERGLASVIAPVTQPRATGAAPPDGPFDALVATSAKAFESMSAEVLEAGRSLPLYLVGAQGARAAGARGLRAADTPAPDVATLVERLRARLATPSRVLYLAGRDRRSELELALRRAGHSVATVEVYAAEAREAWDLAEARAVSRCVAALHYSRRSAELAVRLAERGGIADRFGAMLHVCLSEEAATPLLEVAAKVYRAKSPQEDSLLDALAHALAVEGNDET